ncbi:MAG: Holliday junction branch migration protein RuvA [Bacteroidetes bacterium]|nr:MAG: Holliday junction branch migration protein RuvA [Bacteroidota bacterium]
MIAFIEGIIEDLNPALLIINVNGLGYEIRISVRTYSQLKGKDKCRVQTYLNIKEDAHTLFGFFDSEEKKSFLDLISISGVGPGTALTVLSSLSFDELQTAILREDLKTIQSIKGIGLKTAQRIILELKDKVKKDTTILLSQNIPLNSHSAKRQDALAALVALGIPKPSAEKTIDTILKTHDANITTEQIIKIALKSA